MIGAIIIIIEYHYFHRHSKILTFIIINMSIEICWILWLQLIQHPHQKNHHHDHCHDHHAHHQHQHLLPLNEVGFSGFSWFNRKLAWEGKREGGEVGNFHHRHHHYLKKHHHLHPPHHLPLFITIITILIFITKLVQKEIGLLRQGGGRKVKDWPHRNSARHKYKYVYKLRKTQE